MIQQVSIPGLRHTTLSELQRTSQVYYPEESCGVLTADETGVLAIRQFANIFEGDKRTGFDMEIPAVTAPRVKAIWHSHPGGLEEPSSDDIQAMQEFRDIGFDVPWLIVTDRSVTAWGLEPAELD